MRSTVVGPSWVTAGGRDRHVSSQSPTSHSPMSGGDGSRFRWNPALWFGALRSSSEHRRAYGPARSFVGDRGLAYALASPRSALLRPGRRHHGAACDGLGAPLRELVDGARGQEQPGERLLLFLLFCRRRFGGCRLGHDNGCGPCPGWAVSPSWRDRQGALLVKHASGRAAAICARSASSLGACGIETGRFSRTLWRGGSRPRQKLALRASVAPPNSVGARAA